MKKFYIIDGKFKQNKAHYILQCLMAAATIGIILIALDAVSNTVMIASFGATSFTVFAMPNLKMSGSRRILGGYFIGSATGFLLRFLGLWISHSAEAQWLFCLLGAVAVGLSLLLMTMTDTEHPPAAGMALGIVLEGSGYQAVIILFVGVLALIGAKYLLRKWLIDLL